MKPSRLFLLLVLVSGALRADVPPFPPVTPEERDLVAVPGEPDAPAVVLFRQAELRMLGYGTDVRYTSRMRVSTRIKILTEEGRRHAELLVPHSRRVRLENLMGRTVQPDGRVELLAAGADPVRTVSSRRRAYVTEVRFPAVKVGSILDLHYELVYNGLFLLDFWDFSDEIPVRRSEIVYKIPTEIEAVAWNRDPLRVGIRSETVTGKHGSETRVWAENLPAVPAADQAVRAMMLPTFYREGIASQRLFKNWATTGAFVEEHYYKPARKADRGVAARARSLAGEAAGAKDARGRIEAVYRFVRQEIRTDPGLDVIGPDGLQVQKTLADGHGEPVEKALLLQALLRALDVDSRLVWAADPASGPVDPQLANPAWFDTVLVAVELDGRRVFLDPSAGPALALGQLRPGYEGTVAVVLSPDPVKDPKKTEVVALPRMENADVQALVR